MDTSSDDDSSRETCSFDEGLGISIESGVGVETSIVSDMIGHWTSKLRRRTPLANKADSQEKVEVEHSSSGKDQKVFFGSTKAKEDSRDDLHHQASSSSTENTTSSENDLPNLYYACLNTPHAVSSPREDNSPTFPTDDDSDDSNHNPPTFEGQEMRHESEILSESNVTLRKPKAILVDDESTLSPGIRSAFQAPDGPPTKLHELCENCETIADLIQTRATLLELKLPRKDILGFAGMRDNKGRTPMHLLSENKAVANDLMKIDQTDEDPSYYFPGVELDSSFGRKDPSREAHLEKFVLGFLMPASPSAAMARDDEGRIPFEGVITEWVDELHDEMFRRGKNLGLSKSELGFASASMVVVNALRIARKTANRTASVVSSNRSTRLDEPASRRDHGHSISPDIEHGENHSVAVEGVEDTLPNRATSSNVTKEIVRSKCFPVHVRLTNQMYFALTFLSKIIEKLDKLTSSRSVTRVTDTTSPGGIPETDSFDKVIEQSFPEASVYQEVKETIICNVASIPEFVKTILLIENDGEREFALSTTIVRRVIMNKYSVGTWLTAMLQGNKQVSKRAIEYLKYVSDMSATYKPLLKKGKSSFDQTKIEGPCDELQNEISRLQDFVPSILALEEKGVEDVATTIVVRRVMDRIISRPFAVSVIFCDALFLVVLIVGFRSAVNSLLLRTNPRAVMRGIYIANTGIFYFIIRELGKAISLCMITRRARDYLTSFWNLTDLMATLLALISVITIRSLSRTHGGLDIVDMYHLRDLLALTTGFLWLRVLSLLKAVNVKMATFILAILQITRDTLTFGVILCVMVITFAQMFFTVLVPGYCSADGDFEDPDSECVQSEYYYKVYTVLLGEFGAFDRSRFKTWFSLFMMIMYSFMVIIVLLNVLIAIASDSYEKCLMKSQGLFGRARVMLIAELVSFQNLLRKTADAHGPLNGQGSPNSTTSIYSKWWANQSFARNWSRDSIYFFGSSSVVVVLWAIGEIAGYASGEKHGNILMSIGSVLVNIALFAAIMLFLSRGSENISSKRGDLVPAGSNITDNSGLPAFLQRLMLRIMGSSQENWNLFRERDQNEDSSNDEWRGRVHHLQNRMDQLMQESANHSLKQTQILEQLVANTEHHLKTEMTSVDQNVNDLKSELLLEMKQSQEQTLKHIQDLMKTFREEGDNSSSLS